MITMETLFITCGNNLIELKEDIYKKLFKIFPNFEGLVDDDVLDLKCYKIKDEQLILCFRFILCLICGYDDLTNIILHKDDDFKIKFCMLYDYNRAHELLILLEYFAGEMSNDIIFYLCSLCIKKDITLDNSVISYMEDRMQYIRSKDNYNKYMILASMKKFVVKKVISHMDLKYNLQNFEKRYERMGNGSIYRVYYPKYDCDNIEKIIIVDEDEIIITYKYKPISAKRNKIWFTDNNNLYTAFVNNNVYINNIGDKMNIKHLGTSISFNYNDKLISFITEEELYRIAVNPKLEDVCEAFRQMVLHS